VITFMGLEVHDSADCNVNQTSFAEFEAALQDLMDDVRITGIQWEQYATPYGDGFADNLAVRISQNNYRSEQKWLPIYGPDVALLTNDLRTKINTVHQRLQSDSYSLDLFNTFGSLVRVRVFPRDGQVELLRSI